MRRTARSGRNPLRVFVPSWFNPLRLSRPRVELLMDGDEPVLVNVGINLRCGDVAVAKQFLDHSQVGPAADEGGGEAVAERVGGDALEQLALAAVALDEHPQA